MVDANDISQTIEKLKEELWNMVVTNPNLLDPEILMLSRKIDELMNENNRLTLSNAP